MKGAQKRQQKHFSRQDIDALWEACHGLVDDPVRLKDELVKAKVKKEASAVISADIGLGISVRAALVLLEAKVKVENEFGAEKASVRNLMQLGNSAPASSDGRGARAIVALVNEERRKRPGSTTTLTLKRFATRPFTGKDAVKDFVAWITRDTLDSYLDELEAVKALDFIDAEEGSERGRRKSEIVAFLERQDGPSVCVAHKVGMTFGLSALANQLCRMDLAGKPVCYLALSRLADPYGPVTLPRLVSRLDAFFKGDDPADADESKLGSPNELEAAIQRIRQGLWRTSAIIMLDGHGATTGWYPTLTAVIRDDPLQNLLPRLIHPPFEGIHLGPAATATAGAGGSKILVLSEADLRHLKPFGAEDKEIPYPAADKLAALVSKEVPPDSKHVGGQTFRQRERLARLVLRETWLQSDGMLQMADRLLEMDATREALDECWATAAKRGERPPGMVDLCALFAAGLAHRPRLLLLLRLIAQSETGLRLSTATDLLERWQLVARKNHYPELPETEGDAPIGEGLKELSPIVTVGEDEALAELDTGDHPYEYPYVEELRRKNRPPATKDRADIRLREVKEGLAAQMLIEEPEQARALHRLAAEECIRQQTILMRNLRPGSLASIRFFRRMIEGLLHGFMSLPPIGAPTTAGYAILPYAHTLPNEATRAYVRLHTILYRAILENPPAWDLSRTYAVDRLKFELLQLAANPGSLGQKGSSPKIREILLKPYNGLDAPVSGAAKPPDPPYDDAAIAELQGDHLLSLANAAYRANELAEAGAAVTLGKGIVRSSRMKQQFLKAELDLRLLAFNSQGLAKVEERCREALTEVGLFADTLNPLINIADSLKDMPTGLVDVALRDKVRDWAKEAARAKSTEMLDSWAELLDRLAEANAHLADAPNDNWDKALQLFRYALVIYLGAERLRIELTRRAPLSRDYALSGHATRTFMRVALKMRNMVHDHKLTTGAPTPDFLLRRARLLADIHTRQMFRFPSEQASSVLLESSFARLVDKNYEFAAVLIGKVETYLNGTGETARLHLRFMLERAKILRRLAETRRGTASDQHIAALLDAAERDAKRIINAAKRYGYDFWSTLAEIQEKHVSSERAAARRSGVRSPPTSAPRA